MVRADQEASYKSYKGAPWSGRGFRRLELGSKPTLTKARGWMHQPGVFSSLNQEAYTCVCPETGPHIILLRCCASSAA
eukprot:356925-Chlamydomonas_euryale.AAC.4